MFREYSTAGVNFKSEEIGRLTLVTVMSSIVALFTIYLSEIFRDFKSPGTAKDGEHLPWFSVCYANVTNFWKSASSSLLVWLVKLWHGITMNSRVVFTNLYPSARTSTDMHVSSIQAVYTRTRPPTRAVLTVIVIMSFSLVALLHLSLIYTITPVLSAKYFSASSFVHIMHECTAGIIFALAWITISLIVIWWARSSNFRDTLVFSSNFYFLCYLSRQYGHYSTCAVLLTNWW